jgi:hypothetical protein
VVKPSALLLAAALACGGSTAPPDQVAREFWQGVERGDPALDCRPLADGVEALAPSVGETLDNESSALVTTSLTRRTAQGELRVTFYTHLTRSDDGWRVDCDATRAEVQKAVVAGSMRELGEALGRGARELGESIDEGVRELDRALRDALAGSEPP